MQRLFMPGSPWGSVWAERVVPIVERIAGRYVERTAFTRFIPPVDPSQMAGMWQRYFERWHDIARSRIDNSILELVPALAGFAPPAILVDKHVYSAFSNASFLRWIRDHQISGFVVTGAETDVCILSSVMAGIDLGLRMTIVTDGVASSSDAGHDALLELYDQRFSEQVDMVTHEELLEVWRP